MRTLTTIAQHGHVAKGRTAYLTTAMIETIIAGMMEPPMSMTREQAIKFLVDQGSLTPAEVSDTEALNTESTMPQKKQVSITEISKELAKPSNQRVLASVNEETGAVHTFLAPTSPTEGFHVKGGRYVRNEQTVTNDVNENDGLPAAISPDNLEALLTEFSDLMRRIGSMSQGDAAKAKNRLDSIRHILDRIRDGMIADSDHERRAQERGPQTSSNNTLMAKLEQIRNNMRAIIESPAKA